MLLINFLKFNQMKVKIQTVILAMLIGLTSASTFASAITEIEAANKAGKAVFLVVTDIGISETENAMKIANQAHKLYAKSVVVKMNRSETVNKEIVEKYRLISAPLPLILVIASNGIATGGFLYNQATAEKIVSLIPTPKKAEVLEAISNGKSVFLVVSKKSMKENKEVMSKCEIACTEMNNNAKVISIDIDDKNETAFINELKIDKSITQPQTYVINAQGQLTGTLNGVIDSKILVATAKKRIAGGCCSPGSGKSCGPTK